MAEIVFYSYKRKLHPSNPNHIPLPPLCLLPPTPAPLVSQPTAQTPPAAPCFASDAAVSPQHPPGPLPPPAPRPLRATPRQIFSSPYLAASVSLRASLARPRPPAMALASGTSSTLSRPAGTARPHLAVSSSADSSIWFPNHGGSRAVTLHVSSPPSTWVNPDVFLFPTQLETVGGTFQVKQDMDLDCRNLQLEVSDWFVLFWIWVGGNFHAGIVPIFFNKCDNHRMLG
jgi:hypothetical protein